MQLTIELEQAENGYWVASIREVPGALSQGRTKKSAIANVLDAMIELDSASLDTSKDKVPARKSSRRLALSS